MRLACITGASSGIGEEFAYQLAEKHYDLILVARSAEKLEEIAGILRKRFHVFCEVIPCDLSRQEECLRLLDILKKRNLYLLINNAGFGDIGPFQETSREIDLKMIDVNIRALHLLTKGVLQRFLKRNRGYILNVASVAGLLDGGPLMATYYATKSYVVSLTSSIAGELRKSGSHVHVSALCPGPVDTNFNEVAGVSFSLKGLSANACVSYCLKQMNRGRLIIIPGVMPRLGAFCARLVPMGVVLDATARAQASKL